MKSTQKRRYIADFETVTWLENETSVWAWGVMEIASEDYEMGEDIGGFINWCREHAGSIVYFHNLKFDGEFIIWYLLTSGYKCTNGETGRTAKSFNCIISEMGQFYKITIRFDSRKTITIIDSLKIIPFGVKKIPDKFGLNINKLDINYFEERQGGGLKENDKKYLLNDLLIPGRAIKMFLDEGLYEITQASNAYKNYRDMIGRNTFRHFFPVLKLNVDENIRKSYKGGFTYLNPIYEGKVLNEGIVIDVNSLYPWVMRTAYLPIGEPRLFKGKYKKDLLYDLYIQQLSCTFELKPGKIPMIQVKNNQSFSPTEYLVNSGKDTIVLTLTNIDLELFFENYNVYNPVYIGGWKFRGLKGLFNKYIDYWTEQKIKHGKEGNAGKKQAAKLMLNALYGRFGLNAKSKMKIPYLENEIVKYKTVESEDREPIYVPMAAFITAYARKKTIETSQVIRDYSIKTYGVDKYIYSDTDSIHTLLSAEELLKIVDIDDYRLGAWKIETKFKRARFIQPKRYIEDMGGKLNIKCAGLPERCYGQVTFDNFRRGIGTIYYDKLRYKHVKGGVKLVPTTFQMDLKKLEISDIID